MILGGMTHQESGIWNQESQNLDIKGPRILVLVLGVLLSPAALYSKDESEFRNFRKKKKQKCQSIEMK